MLPLQAGDVPRTHANVDALLTDVGFMPKMPIEEGISRFVRWYKNYYGVV